MQVNSGLIDHWQLCKCFRAHLYYIEDIRLDLTQDRVVVWGYKHSFRLLSQSWLIKSIVLLLLLQQFGIYFFLLRFRSLHLVKVIVIDSLGPFREFSIVGINLAVDHLVQWWEIFADLAPVATHFSNQRFKVLHQAVCVPALDLISQHGHFVLVIILHWLQRFLASQLLLKTR